MWDDTEEIDDENYDIEEDAIYDLVNYIDDIYSGKLPEILPHMNLEETITNKDDLYDYLMTVDCDDFEKTMTTLINNENIKLINLDGEEPSFGEL